MRKKSELPSKDCLNCGRPFVWRKKWERDWDNVKYCSDACRSRGASGASGGAEPPVAFALQKPKRK